MKLSIGKTINTLRNQNKITKEELSKAIGVTVEAIEGWENGNTYPEITLLSPIAKYLGTDVDSLLMFETKLTPDEVMNINRICAEGFETKDYDTAISTCDKYLNRYPESLFLKFRIGSLLQQYIQLADSEEKANETIDKSIGLLEEAMIIDDLEVKQASLYVLSSLYTMKQDYNKAIDILNALPKLNINPDFMLSTIYSMTGEGIKAKKIEQESLFNSVNNTIISLTGMWGTALKDRDFDFAIELAKLQRKMISDYQLEPFMLGNNILLFADIAALIKDIDLTLDYIESFADWILELDEDSMDLSRNKFFSLVENDNIISNIEYLKQHFLNSVVKNDNYDFVKYTDRYKKIISKII
jgi:transcriptional regulator with XRE-family HTH domain